jgi:NADPH-dependent 2,4-dienoyl-CoA reductase/sulfur reductase-like enzyme
VAAADVAVHLGREATADDVVAAASELAVVATGATWHPSLAAVARYLRGESDDVVGPRVVVQGGGKVGLTIAGALRRRGHEVTVIESGNVLALELGLPGRFRLVHDLEAAGVDLRTGTTELPDADTVVVTTPLAHDTSLADAIRDAGVNSIAIGDGIGPGMLEAANLAVAQLAFSLSI